MNIKTVQYDRIERKVTTQVFWPLLMIRLEAQTSVTFPFLHKNVCPCSVSLRYGDGNKLEPCNDGTSIKGWRNYRGQSPHHSCTSSRPSRTRIFHICLNKVHLLQSWALWILQIPPLTLGTMFVCTVCVCVCDKCVVPLGLTITVDMGLHTRPCVNNTMIKNTNIFLKPINNQNKCSKQKTMICKHVGYLRIPVLQSLQFV